MNTLVLQSVRLGIGLALLGLVAGTAASAPTSPVPNDDRQPVASDKLSTLFHQLEPREAIQHGRLTIVPLQRRGAPTTTTFGGHPSVLGTELLQKEADRAILRLSNDTSLPVLITEGRIAYAGNAEFVTLHDAVVPPGGRRTIETRRLDPNVAAPKGEYTVRWYPRWAPTAVRDGATLRSTPPLDKVHSVFSGLPWEGLTFSSLRGLVSSEPGRTKDDLLADVLHDERFRGADIVGFIAGIDGRAVALHVFGTAALHRKNASGLLSSKGLYAHATKDSRARPLAGAEAARAVERASRTLLHTLRTKSRWIDERAGRARVEAPGLTGAGIAYAGQAVHATIRPHDPRKHELVPRVD